MTLKFLLSLLFCNLFYFSSSQPEVPCIFKKAEESYPFYGFTSNFGIIFEYEDNYKTYVNDVLDTKASLISASTIEITVSPGIYSFNIIITNGDGIQFCNENIDYDLCTINSVVPNSGPTSGNYNIILNGDYLFVDNTNYFMTIDNDAVTYFVTNSTNQLQFMVPPHAPGNVPIKLVNDDNSATICESSFTYINIPKKNNAIPSILPFFLIQGSNFNGIC